MMVSNPFPQDEMSNGIPMMLWIMPTVDDEPPWWSRSRDKWLREYWQKVDPLSVAVSTFVTKSTNMPWRIVPKDRNIKSHHELAVKFQHNLATLSGVYKGFRSQFEQFTLDYITQDNGAFALVLGDGEVHEPIFGMPYGIMHLDSQLCDRTSDENFPVHYFHKGQKYRIHRTRIIEMANNPSPRADMFGVGFCHLSQCTRSGKEMRDMYIHSSEKFGSRPTRQILYVRKGANMEQLQYAIRIADEKMDSENITHFGKTLLLAPKNAGQELELARLDLTTAPDGFDRREVTLLDLATIAGAFGLDLRDMAMSFGVAGQTRADAEVQDRKGRGKGPGELLDSFTEQIQYKFLPESLQIIFDSNDDEQDEQQASIWNVRSTARNRDLTSGVMTIRVARQLMVETGEISTDQFDDMELSDGRLRNGADVLTLFAMGDPLLDLGVEDPTDVKNNDTEEMMDKLRIAKMDIWKVINTARTSSIARSAREALAACDRLEILYSEAAEPIPPDESLEPELEGGEVAQDFEEGDESVTPPAEAREEKGLEPEVDLEDIERAIYNFNNKIEELEGMLET